MGRPKDVTEEIRELNERLEMMRREAASMIKEIEMEGIDFFSLALINE